MMQFTSKQYLIVAAMLSLLLSSCQKADLQPVETADSGEKLFFTALNFSGYTWTVRNSNNTQQGPGGNYFSPKNTVVFVDANGDLHLKILKNNKKWLCSEVYMQQATGYGKYIFTTKGNLESYDKKIVAGLFTWDNFNYQSQANSELDVEFARWGIGNNTDVMSYSVQPTRGGVYTERAFIPTSDLVYDVQGYTTHIIDWNASRVKFESHSGEDTTIATLTHSFVFDTNNPPRTANEGGVISDPIVIPAPGSDTRPHINFWLFDANGNGKGDAPSNGLNAELVIHKFQYIPY
ncbi:MAG TPA: glycoside hydrolase family 16 protein [Chitinophagales bacterium]|nr:glycoside hydrolase family 16 protein [Chitinophagales bacterium]